MTDEITLDGPMTEALELVARMEGVDVGELVDGILRDRLADYRLAADHVVRAIDAIDLEDEPWDSPTTPSPPNGDGQRPTGSNSTGQPSTTSTARSDPSTGTEDGGKTATTAQTSSSGQPDRSSTPDPEPEPDPDGGLTDGQWSHLVLDLIQRAHDAGVSIADIADVVDRSAPTVYGWRSNAKVPRDDDILAALEAFDPLDLDEGDIPANNIPADVTPPDDDGDPCQASGCDDPPTADNHGLCGRHARIMSGLATGMRHDLDKPEARRVALDGLIEHGDNVSVLGARGLLRRHADDNGRDPETCRAADCGDPARGGWCNRHRHAVRTLADNIRPEVGHAATKQAAAAVVEHGDDANYDLAIAGAA